MDKLFLAKALNTISSSQNDNKNDKNEKNEENTIIENKNNVINEEAKKYFVINLKEDNPIILDKWTNIRYYNLELIFDTFYPLTSLAIAKNTSKEERIARKIKDKSFTYGEIVFKIILNFYYIITLIYETIF